MLVLSFITSKERFEVNYEIKKYQFVASPLFKVAGSLQSKQNAGLSEQQQQQGYLFQMNTVIPHETLQQAHAILDL